MTSADDPQPTDPDPVELLIAECLAHSASSGNSVGEGEITEICRAHPELEATVRRRLDQLARFGLLQEAGVDSPVTPHFEHFELLEQLGSGGMGVVWLARDRRSGKRVALKTADPRVPWSERMRERFRREVSAASRLNHPHVVPIEDVGEESGLPYYTMEYVDGVTLADLIHAVRERSENTGLLRVEDLHAAWQALLPGHGETSGWGETYVEALCRIVLDVADALTHVHSHGIVHRDVKPANVLVDASGRAHLFDLGLAHLADHPALTQTADFAGSPHYASPEQIGGSGRILDGRTDVYSLGVTLFEAFALRPPFQAANTPQLMRQIQLREPPLLRSLSALVPRELEAVCRTCLEKKPEHRYASAELLAADLRRFLRFQPVHARPAGGLRRALRIAARNPAWAAAGTLAAGLVIAAPLGLWRHEVRLRAERDRANDAAVEARREAEENRQVSEFLESLVLHLDESGEDAHRDAARDLIELAIDRVAGSAHIDATTRASLLVTVAGVLRGMERPGDAVSLLNRAFAIRQRTLGDGHPSTAQVLRQLAILHQELGNHDEARALARRSLSSFGDDTGDLRASAVRTTLAGILREHGELDEAEQLLRTAHAAHLAADTENGVSGARTLRELGELELARGDIPGAVEWLERSRSVLLALPSPPLEELASSVDALGRAHAAQGRDRQACALWSEALGLLRKRAGDRSPLVRDLLRRLTESLERQLEAEASAELARQLASNLLLLARSDRRAEDPRAEQSYRGALAHLRGVPNARSDLGQGLVELALLCLADERSGEASGLLLEAERLQRGGAFPAELWPIRGLQELAKLEAHGLVAAPANLVAAASARLAAWSGPRDAELSEVLSEQGRLLERAGRWREAAELLARATAPAPAPILRPFAERELDAFDERARWGVTALQAGRQDEAARAFRECLEIRPDDAVAAYNLACALALGGRRGPALDALSRATDNGYAYRENAVRLTLEDTDLASLRGDPRFESIVTRMGALAQAAEAYAFQPTIHVPASLDPASPMPLLVVLHADGESKESTSSGPWRDVADRLGYALLVPAGRVPLGSDPAHGTRWAESDEQYARRNVYFERPVREAFAVFRERYTADPTRVFVAGHGLGGTLAFNLAVHSPELVRGVVLVGAEINEDLASDKAPHLGSMGMRATLLTTARALPEAESLSASLAAAGTFRQLREWGIRSSMGTWPASGRRDLCVEVLERAVRWLEP